MKIVNTGTVPKKLWVLGIPHLKLLKQLGIGFNDINSVIQKSYIVNSDDQIVELVSSDDVVDLITLQYKFACLFNKEMEPADFKQGLHSVYNDLIVSKIKSNIDTKSKLQHLDDLKHYTKYYVTEHQDTVVLVLAEDLTEANYIGEHYTVFTNLECTSVKTATLKAFYKVFGYSYLHFQDCLKELSSKELSLENVFESLA